MQKTEVGNQARLLSVEKSFHLLIFWCFAANEFSPHKSPTNVLLLCCVGNRFSRKKREKEKAQEAMAWEVTKMIIAGVKEEVSSSSQLTIPGIEVEGADSETANESLQITKL